MEKKFAQNFIQTIKELSDVQLWDSLEFYFLCSLFSVLTGDGINILITNIFDYVDEDLLNSLSFVKGFGRS